MKYILTFENTNLAIKSEILLLNIGVNVTVRPLPPIINAGCGIVLAIGEENLLECKILLDESDVTYKIYKTENNKKYFAI